MKKIDRRSFLKAMGLVGGAAALAGCGAAASSTAAASSAAASSAPASSAASSEAVSTDPVTIHVFHYMVEGNKSAALEKIEAAFTAKYPNATFENTAYSQGTDYFSQLSTAIASGDMPEVMMGNPGLYTDLIDGGFVMDLTGNKVISGLGLTDADMGDVSYNGKWYAYPVDFKTWGVFYNKKIFADQGFELPKTLTELLTICQKLKDGGIDPWAQWYSDGASVDIEMRPIVWTKALANGDKDMFAKLMSNDKKIADYPYFQEGLESWQKRMGNWARSDAMSNDQTAANEVFIAGEAAMLYQGTWNYGSIETLLKDGGTQFDYSFFLCPTDDSGKDPVMNVQVDQSFMVNPQSANAEWGCRFMEFWLTDCMGLWSDESLQPCITGVTTSNTSDFLKSILTAKASGNIACYGEFTAPFTSAYTAAYRKALTAFASYCCTGKETDGVKSVDTCLSYMQELFDEEYKQAKL